MTVKNTYEELKQLFPEIGETQILSRIDRAQKFICKNNVLEDRASLSSPTENFAWTLPSDFKSLKQSGLRFYDSDGNPLYLDYAYDIVFGKIIIYSLSTPITGLDSSITTAQIEYYKNSASITSTGDTFDLPEEYYDAIAAYAREFMYADFNTEIITKDGVIKSKDWNAVKYWSSKAKELTREAKKNLNREPAGSAVYYPYAGKLRLPERPLDVSSTTILKGFSVSKLINFTAVNSTSTVTEDNKVGFGNISYNLSGDTLIITSSGEFTQGLVHIEASNSGEFNWAWDSSNQITITYLSGWTISNVLIYIV